MVDEAEGIPLWDFIKPKQKNRIREIRKLLRFYSEYQDQIDQDQENVDLFITELLYAGYDCLISNNWLGEMASPGDFLRSFDIPPNSQLTKLTLLLEEYYHVFGEINHAKKLFEIFPIVYYSRIGRDLKLRQKRMVRRETDLKTDPEKFAIKPIPNKDLGFKVDSDLPPIIKKNSDRFEEQFSKDYPRLASGNILSKFDSEMVYFSNIISRTWNDLPTVSQITNEVTSLVKHEPETPRRRGAGKGNHPSKKIFSDSDEEDILKDYQIVSIGLKKIRSGREVEKNVSQLVKLFGGEYADQIRNEEYPNQLAFDLIRGKYKVGKNRLYKIIKKIK
jgi:hypothetical protein